MPEGDAKKTPEPPKFTPGWQLGEPDLVVKMEEPFDIPAGGPDIFRNFAIPLNLQKDQWVKAIEFRPSANASHHALFFLDQTGEAVQLDKEDPKPGFTGMNFLARSFTGGALAGGGRGGLGQRGQRGQLGQRGGGAAAALLSGSITGLGGWAVGGTPHALPEGLAHAVPKNSDLVLQMHFHPIGKVQHEQATIGFYFTDSPPKRTLTALQLPPLFGALAGIDIPPGEKRFVIRDSFVLPIDVDVISAGAHAHYLASDMRMTATFPDGGKKDVLHIPNWDFNWQERYYFKNLVRLPKGTRLDVEIAYDNSPDNPHNPANPPKRVRFGQQSTDEMGSVTIEVTPANERDLPEYREAVAEHLQQSVVGLIFNGRGAR